MNAAAADDTSTAVLCDTANELMQQFESIMGRIKLRAAASTTSTTAAAAAAAPPAAPVKSAAGGSGSRQRQRKQQVQHQPQARGDATAAGNCSSAVDVCQCDKPAAKLPPLASVHGHQQPQQQPQKPQQVATNESNFAGGSFQPVVTEPSELRLVLKLHTWIADNGSLVVRPSIYEDREGGCCGDASANNSQQLLASCQKPQQLQLPPQNRRLGYSSSDNSDEAALAVAADVVRQQVPQQKLQQQQPVPAPQSKLRLAAAPAATLESKRLRSLNTSVQEIARQLGAIHGGGGGGFGVGGVGNRRRSDATAVPSTSYASYFQQQQQQQQFTGGDGCQTNNHHDSSSVSDDQMSGQSSGTPDSEATGSFGQQQQPACSAASPEREPIDRTTRALIQRLNALIEKDPAADSD